MKRRALTLSEKRARAGRAGGSCVTWRKMLAIRRLALARKGKTAGEYRRERGA